VCHPMGSGMRRYDRDDSPNNVNWGFWNHNKGPYNHELSLSFEPQHRVLFLLYHDTFVCPRLDLRYPLYLCSISLPTNTIQLIDIISYLLWPSHLLASVVDMILPSGPIVASFPNWWRDVRCSSAMAPASGVVLVPTCASLRHRIQLHVHGAPHRYRQQQHPLARQGLRSTVATCCNLV
jgi:hypothetical protein